VENGIRVLLDEILADNDKALYQNLTSSSEALKTYPVSIFFLKTGLEINIAHPVSRSPYYFVLNDFIICFFGKKKSLYKPY
jgi:hypothetical protein